MRSLQMRSLQMRSLQMRSHPPTHPPTWILLFSSFSSTASLVACRPRTIASPSPPASAPPTPAEVNWT